MKYFKYLGAKMMGRSLGKERLGFCKNQNKKKKLKSYQEVNRLPSEREKVLNVPTGV